MTRYSRLFSIAGAFGAASFIHLVFGLWFIQPWNEFIILIGFGFLALAVIYVRESQRRFNREEPPIWIVVMRSLYGFKTGWVLFWSWIIFYIGSMVSLNSNPFAPYGTVFSITFMYDQRGHWGNDFPEYAALVLLGLWMLYLILKSFAHAWEYRRELRTHAHNA